LDFADREHWDGFWQCGLVLFHLGEALFVEPEVEDRAALDIERNVISAGAFLHGGATLFK
jgi:hypothetical protein